MNDVELGRVVSSLRLVALMMTPLPTTDEIDPRMERYPTRRPEPLHQDGRNALESFRGAMRGFHEAAERWEQLEKELPGLAQAAKEIAAQQDIWALGKERHDAKERARVILALRVEYLLHAERSLTLGRGL